MLLELVLFFTIASAITTVAVMLPGLMRARAWASIPIGLVILAGAGWLTGLIAHDPVGGTILPLFGIGAVIETRRHLPQWSMLASQMLATVLVASTVYLVYAGIQPFVDQLGLLGIVVSFLLLLHWGRWRRVSITAPIPKRGRMVPPTGSWAISPVSQPAPARITRPIGMLAHARARINPGSMTETVVIADAIVKKRTSSSSILDYAATEPPDRASVGFARGVPPAAPAPSGVAARGTPAALAPSRRRRAARRPSGGRGARRWQRRTPPGHEDRRSGGRSFCPGSGPGYRPPGWRRPVAPSTSPRRRSGRSPHGGSSGRRRGRLAAAH